MIHDIADRTWEPGMEALSEFTERLHAVGHTLLDALEQA
jgi:hypothetical protein